MSKKIREFSLVRVTRKSQPVSKCKAAGQQRVELHWPSNLEGDDRMVRGCKYGAGSVEKHVTSLIDF